VLFYEYFIEQSFLKDHFHLEKSKLEILIDIIIHSTHNFKVTNSFTLRMPKLYGQDAITSVVAKDLPKAPYPANISLKCIYEGFKC